MVVRFAVVIAAVAVLAGSAGASTGPGGWSVTQWSGNTFSGVFTNTTRDPINGVSVGTALKEGNPITAFTIANVTCQLYAAYGSAYCYVALLIQPGATVAFRGVAKNKLTPAGVVMCSSADRGMDNTCTNVPLTSKKQTIKPTTTHVITTTASSGTVVKVQALKEAAILAHNDVVFALQDERKALETLNVQSVGDALDSSRKFLQGALSEGFHDAFAEDQIKDAIRDDTHALDSLNENGSGAMATVDRFVKSAIAHKNVAVKRLKSLAR